jgi:hypothetical protein
MERGGMVSITVQRDNQRPGAVWRIFIRHGKQADRASFIPVLITKIDLQRKNFAGLKVFIFASARGEDEEARNEFC